MKKKELKKSYKVSKSAKEIMMAYSVYSTMAKDEDDRDEKLKLYEKAYKKNNEFWKVIYKAYPELENFSLNYSHVIETVTIKKERDLLDIDQINP